MRILPILFLLILFSLILPYPLFANEQEATSSAKLAVSITDVASPSSLLEQATTAAQLTEQTVAQPPSEWIQHANGSYTVNNLIIDRIYTPPFQNRVAIRFTNLPQVSATFTAKQIAEYAYEFTSPMEDGTFRYDLTLPLPEDANENAVVSYSEDGTNFAAVENEKEVDASSRTITVKNLMHFTIFTVTTVSDFNAGVSTDTTITDTGGGDGSVTNTLGAETSDASQTTGTTTESFDNTKWLAQTFTASQSGLLTKVTLSLKRAASTDGNVTVEIRNITTAKPGTTVLATADRQAFDLTTSQADYDFSFATPSALLTGTSYAIVVYRSGSGTITADYTWYRGVAGSGNDQYTNGSRFTSSDSGITWTQQTVANPGTGDLRFTIVRQSYETTGTHTSDVINAGTPSSFTELSWTESLATGTDITFEVRGASTSFVKTDTAPSWVSLGSMDSPVTLMSFLSQSIQYFQWRATLVGTATTSATLKNVSVTYNPIATPTTPSSSSPNVGSPSVPICSDGKPESAPKLTAAIVGVNSVTLSWEEANDPVSYYLIAYGTTPGSLQFGNPNIGSKGTTTFTVSELSGETRYYFRIRAGNGCTPGDYSNELVSTPRGVAISSRQALGFAPGVLGGQQQPSLTVEAELALPAVQPVKTGFLAAIGDFLTRITTFLGRIFGK